MHPGADRVEQAHLLGGGDEARRGSTSPRSGSFQRSSASIECRRPLAGSHDRLVVQDQLVLRAIARRSRARQREPLERVVGDAPRRRSRPRARGPCSGTSPRRRAGAARSAPSASSGKSEMPMLASTWNSAPDDRERLGEPRASCVGRRARGRLGRRRAGGRRSRSRNSSPPRRASSARARPRHAAQAPGDPPQQPVAGAVAERVVDELEVVEVDEQQRDRAVRARARA